MTLPSTLQDGSSGVPTATPEGETAAPLPTYVPPHRAPWGWWSSRGTEPRAPVRPFQFPSLEHLDARVAAAAEHARGTEGLRDTTLRWWAGSYRSLRTFLKESREETTFLRGQPEDQARLLGLWVAALRERGVSHYAVATYWRGLRSVFARFEAANRMLNPLTLVPAPRASLGQPRCLPRHSAEQVLIFVRNYPWRTRFTRLRNVAIVGLMLLAGLRRGEVVRLRYEDIHLDEGAIRVVRSKGPHGGKDRMAYMSPQLTTILGQYDDERRRVRRTCPSFLSLSQLDRGITESTVNELFKVVSRRSGEKVTPHMLRHTYATLLRQSGVPDRVSMDLLGHNSLQVLQRYSHVFSEEHRREAARLWLDDGT